MFVLAFKVVTTVIPLRKRKVTNGNENKKDVIVITQLTEEAFENCF